MPRVVRHQHGRRAEAAGRGCRAPCVTQRIMRMLLRAVGGRAARRSSTRSLPFPPRQERPVPGPTAGPARGATQNAEGDPMEFPFQVRSDGARRPNMGAHQKDSGRMWSNGASRAMASAHAVWRAGRPIACSAADRDIGVLCRVAEQRINEVPGLVDRLRLVEAGRPAHVACGQETCGPEALRAAETPLLRAAGRRLDSLCS